MVKASVSYGCWRFSAAVRLSKSIAKTVNPPSSYVPTGRRFAIGRDSNSLNNCGCEALALKPRNDLINEGIGGEKHSWAIARQVEGILRDFNAPPGRGPRRDACLSASQHLLHRSRSVGPAAASEVPLRGERLRYLPQRLPLSVQLAHQRHHLR